MLTEFKYNKTVLGIKDGSQLPKNHSWTDLYLGNNTWSKEKKLRKLLK